MSGKNNTSCRAWVLRCNNIREGLRTIWRIVDESVFLNLPAETLESRYYVASDESYVLAASRGIKILDR